MTELRQTLASMLHRVPGYTRLRFQQKGGSISYWQRRYQTGGNSGDGSYGRLAEFKAEFLNNVVARESIGSVIEFGCGDGNQLRLARYPRYLGLDVSPAAVERCARQFSGDSSKSFVLYEPRSFYDNAGFLAADLTLSLDVLFHVIEDDLYLLYLDHLFSAAHRFVIVYAADEDSSPAAHVKFRKFSRDIQERFRDWELRDHVPNRYPNESVCSFFLYARRGAGVVRV